MNVSPGNQKQQCPSFRVPNGPSIDVFQALLGYHPVGLVALVAFVAVLRDHDPVGALIAIPVVIFLASPLVLVPHGAPRGLIRMAAPALLCVWAIPLLAYYSPQLVNWTSSDSLAWGYYLFAGAHMFAFVAVLVGPWRGRRTDRRRGFPMDGPPRDLE
jgi:hypothetical protein